MSVFNIMLQELSSATGLCKCHCNCHLESHYMASLSTEWKQV